MERIGRIPVDLGSVTKIKSVLLKRQYKVGIVREVHQRLWARYRGNTEGFGKWSVFASSPNFRAVQIYKPLVLKEEVQHRTEQIVMLVSSHHSSQVKRPSIRISFVRALSQ